MEVDGDKEMDIDTREQQITLFSHDQLVNENWTNKVLKTIKFRNYVPIDETLRKCCVDPPVNLVKQIEGEYNTQSTQKKEDSLLLVPKEPNEDLKRDLKSKMDILERNTQRSLVKLIREKLNNTPTDTSSVRKLLRESLADHMDEMEE
eukprot:TRINITY_DN10277_c0_g1_i1.p1 TRINITY_DN10277_c0_g1~~TRINITY_DN10277_c0_g1_i1.p1  ORF type:complete len:148 (-),score=33.59 TRINITY_DN10277_c0_g1_i1:18-461(-)